MWSPKATKLGPRAERGLFIWRQRNARHARTKRLRSTQAARRSRPRRVSRSPLKPREALESLFAAWRAGDALRSAAHFGVDATYREARGEPIAGRDAITAHFTRFFRDGPQWRFEVEEIIVEGEQAAVRYRFAVAGPEGEWREKPGCAFVAFRDGTVAEWREYEG